MKLLNLLIYVILKDKLLKIVDRIFGIAFGGVKALLCIFIVLTLGNYFIDQPYAAVVKEQITSGSVSNVFYENNIVKSLCDKYLNFDDLLGQITEWIGGSSNDESEPASDGGETDNTPDGETTENGDTQSEDSGGEAVNSA